MTRDEIHAWLEEWRKDIPALMRRWAREIEIGRVATAAREGFCVADVPYGRN